VSGALQGTLYAFVLVSAPSLRMLWRLRESLLALPTLVLALAWTIGLMHLFGIRFNLANIWGLPMILGISAEFGLNVMFRYPEGRAYGGPLLARSTVLGHDSQPSFPRSGHRTAGVPERSGVRRGPPGVSLATLGRSRTLPAVPVLAGIESSAWTFQLDVPARLSGHRPITDPPLF
jgi:hypothetical protein